MNKKMLEEFQIMSETIADNRQIEISRETKIHARLNLVARITLFCLSSWLGETLVDSVQLCCSQSTPQFVMSESNPLKDFIRNSLISAL